MVLKNLEKYNLILASASPRRQQLMKDLGLTFEVKPADVDEFYPENLGMTAIPEYLAQLKADALNGDMSENDLIITADTIVWKDDKVLGKPADHQEAFDMLKSLSGSQHQVITGMHLQSKTKRISFSRGYRSLVR